MNYKFVFLFAVVIMFSFYVCESKPAWDGWKEMEETGQRVFRALQRGLPVVQGYAEAINTFKDKDKD